MAMKRCNQGHDYDTGENTMCPRCGSEVPDSDVADIKSAEDFFTQAWDEINDQNKTPNKALWAKAFAFAEGDEKRTQAKYIELRVAQLEENHAQQIYADSCRPFTDVAIGMEFVFVKGGCFDMGDTFGDGNDDEKPVHEVCLTDFFMGKHQVTQGQWKAIMESNPSHFQDGGDNYPVENVSWDDAQEFIRRLNSTSLKQYRLPTEAEWEYAARSGGKKEKWAVIIDESSLDDYAWYSSNSGDKTHPVRQKRPNGLGIYDMSGNVWEWVEDWVRSNYYKVSPRDNPLGPSKWGGYWSHMNMWRVMRGGGCTSSAQSLRTARRGGNSPNECGQEGGFRLSANVSLPRIAIEPENIIQKKQIAQEQQRTSAMTKSAFVPPKPSPQESVVFAVPSEKPRQLMSSRVDKGKNCFRWVLYVLVPVCAVKLLFALGHNDPGKKIAETLGFFIGGLILFGGGAFALGWLTGA